MYNTAYHIHNISDIDAKWDDTIRPNQAKMFVKSHETQSHEIKHRRVVKNHDLAKSGTDVSSEYTPNRVCTSGNIQKTGTRRQVGSHIYDSTATYVK